MAFYLYYLYNINRGDFMKKVSIVVPMYNEQEAAPLFFEAIDKVIANIEGYEFEIVAVNDGSRDATLDYLKSEFEKRNNLVVVNLSRNWGHEAAVRAGLLTCTGDAIIPMDADLQDPPELIPSLIEAWESGYDVCNAKRSSRKKDTAFKRNTAGMYYKILQKFTKKVKIPQNVANFRLISRKVLDAVNALPEKDRVFRIEVPFVGFKTCEVLFERPNRSIGETKYSLSSMINLAIQSFTSLTVEPLKIPLYCGLVFFGINMVSWIAQLVLFILDLCNVMMISPLFLSTWLIINIVGLLFCFLLMILGLMGAYLGTAVEESRARPTVIIDEVYKK